MNLSIRHLLVFGLALAALGWSAEAAAQSTADGKRTLKAEKIFYKNPGMIEIEVRAMRGTLMMTGYVPTEEHLKKADELAQKVRGIKDIRNRIRVREPDVASGGDEAIQIKIDKAIEEDEDLAKAKAKGKLEVTVAEGNVTVKGKVTDWTVAQSLVNDIKRIPGVRTLDLDKLKY
ncbi:MAG: BON domain-containing protein [Myxococcota bacterium]